MLKYIYLIAFTFFSNKTIAQLDKIFTNSNLIVVDLKPEKAIDILDSNICYINIIDARDDTSKIGFYSIGKTGEDWPKYYGLTPSIKDGISKWLAEYFTLKSENNTLKCSLLLVIKKLWISSDAVPERTEDGKVLQPKQMGFSPGIVTQIEFYLEKNERYYPIYKVDSIFHYTEKLPGNAAYYITESLKESTRRLFKISIDKVLTKIRSITLDQIIGNNKKYLHSEIISVSEYKKGVYKTFQEFKANNPSITNYELRPGSMGDVIYVKETGAEYPLRTAWGYCDGESLYINSGDKYFKLFKIQNTFYFEGFKGVERTARHDIGTVSIYNLATNTGRKITKFSKIMKYYKLDIETGEAY